MQTEVAAALLFALRDGPLGRRTLVARTEATESTVRTQLNKLRARGWVSCAKVGTSLTAEGRRAGAPLLRVLRAVAQVRLEGLGLAPHQRAAQVRGVSLAPSWALRDRAVRGGASGALVLVWQGQPAFADSGERLAAPRVERALERAFPTLRAGDGLLVAFAPDPTRAARGLWRMIGAPWTGEFLALDKEDR